LKLPDPAVITVFEKLNTDEEDAEMPQPESTERDSSIDILELEEVENSKKEAQEKETGEKKVKAQNPLHLLTSSTLKKELPKKNAKKNLNQFLRLKPN